MNKALSRLIKITLISGTLAAGLVAAQSKDAGDKVTQAVNVVEKLCLSGSEYSLSVDQQGNITIKDYAPDGSGSITLNAREARGAASYQDDLRLIADDKIRNCTQQHIGRVLDAIFENIPAEKMKTLKNNSIRNAKYLGYVPQTVSGDGFVELEDKAYYRFSVKEPAEVRIHVEKNSSDLNVGLLTEKDAEIGSFISAAGRVESHYLPVGDYYVRLMNQSYGRATSYRLVVEAFAMND